MAARMLTAPDGTLWQVWSVIPGQHGDWPEKALRHLPEELTAGWICFESPAEKRRLHPIPAGWEEVDETALWEHCRVAEPVRQRLAGLFTAREAEPAA